MITEDNERKKRFLYFWFPGYYDYPAELRLKVLNWTTLAHSVHTPARNKTFLLVPDSKIFSWPMVRGVDALTGKQNEHGGLEAREQTMIFVLPPYRLIISTHSSIILSSPMEMGPDDASIYTPGCTIVRGPIDIGYAPLMIA